MANGSEAGRFSPEEFVARDRLGALLGARFISVTPEQCLYEYEPPESHLNPVDTLHGGALFTVMDSSQGMLVHSLLTPPYRPGVDRYGDDQIPGPRPRRKGPRPDHPRPPRRAQALRHLRRRRSEGDDC